VTNAIPYNFLVGLSTGSRPWTISSSSYIIKTITCSEEEGPAIAEAKTTRRRTKAEVVEDYDKIRNRLDELGSPLPAERDEEKALVERASSHTIDSIVKGMADLNLTIGRALGELTEKMTIEARRLRLKDAQHRPGDRHGAGPPGKDRPHAVRSCTGPIYARTGEGYFSPRFKLLHERHVQPPSIHAPAYARDGTFRFTGARKGETLS